MTALALFLWLLLGSGLLLWVSLWLLRPEVFAPER